MAAKFRLNPEADSQLGDILEFIAHQSESGAIRVRHAVYDALTKLAGVRIALEPRVQASGPTPRLHDCKPWHRGNQE
jgi:plasmid stabilization system protein ParE